MIAILGATGYIGRSLARRLATGGEPLTLFARDPSRLADELWPSNVVLRAVSAFEVSSFDLVINAIGAGDPRRLALLGDEILKLTRFWDDRVLANMGPQTAYVFLSSGAVYGRFEAADPDQKITRQCPALPAYTRAKLAAEAGHCQAQDRAVLDVRVFGYADLPVDLSGTSLFAELASSLVRGTTLIVQPENIQRDYVGADELADLIARWVGAGAPNTAMDIFSKRPVTKFELLTEVQRRYGLRIETKNQNIAHPTGAKPFYVPRNRDAAKIGYKPLRTSLEVILSALERLLDAPPARNESHSCRG